MKTKLSKQSLYFCRINGANHYNICFKSRVLRWFNNVQTCRHCDFCSHVVSLVSISISIWWAQQVRFKTVSHLYFIQTYLIKIRQNLWHIRNKTKLQWAEHSLFGFCGLKKQSHKQFIPRERHQQHINNNNNITIK